MTSEMCKHTLLPEKQLASGPRMRKSTDPPELFPTPPEVTKDSPWLRPMELGEEVVFKQEHDAEPMTKEQVEDEVLAAVEEAKKPDWQVQNERKAILSALRKLDDKQKRTCGKCLKRLPIDMFRRHERSEVCEDCE